MKDWLAYTVAVSLGLLAMILIGLGSPTADEAVDYPREIKPLLARRCYACHGALKP